MLLAHAKRRGKTLPDGSREVPIFHDRLALNAGLTFQPSVTHPSPGHHALAVLKSLGERGLLELADGLTLGSVVRIPRWKKYQEDALHARRQASYRERQKSRPPSRSVTTPSPTGTRTGTETKGKAPPTPSRPSVNRKAVSDEHLELAGQIVGAFNERAGSDFSLEAWLTPIVMRIREHPTLTLEDHRVVIAAAFRRPWWEGRPQPSVVYGKAGVFEGALDDAKRAGGSATLAEWRQGSFGEWAQRQREKEAEAA